MGRLHYGTRGDAAELDDRLLRHLELLTVSKLRRNEGFLLSWIADGRRTSVWISPASELRFESSSEDAVAIDRRILDEALSAASRAGSFRIEDLADALAGTAHPARI